MKIDSVHIERDCALRCHEISVCLSADDEEGVYTFVISSKEWAAAVERGKGPMGNGELRTPPPWLLAAKKVPA